MFSEIPRESAATLCARKLREAILGGSLRPGERLPPERRLADSFGVNRVTLRSALARLAAEHLVVPRQGSGYTVHDYRETGGPDLIESLLALATGSRAEEIVRDLLRVRRYLAMAVLERLLERDAVDTARIDAAIDELEALVEDAADTDAIARADLAVAAAFVAATGSDVLRLCMNPVASVLTRAPALARAMFVTAEENVASWRAVAALLHARDAQLLGTVAEHLRAHDERTLRVFAHEESR